MHPTNLSFSPLPTLSPTHLPPFSPPHLSSLLPFASKSFSDRIFFINFEAKFVTTEKYE